MRGVLLEPCARFVGRIQSADTTGCIACAGVGSAGAPLAAEGQVEDEAPAAKAGKRLRDWPRLRDGIRLPT